MKRSLSELMDLLGLGVLDYDSEAVEDLRENSDDYLRHIDFCMCFCDDDSDIQLMDQLKDFIFSLHSEV